MADSTEAAPKSAPLPQLLIELRDMIVEYVKQETLIPLRQLGRYVGFGIAGSLLLGLGVVLLAVGGLRALQTETGTTFTGDWSWAPYAITVVGLLIGGTLTWKLRGSRKRKREKEQS
jgi:hypothetical protein